MSYNIILDAEYYQSTYMNLWIAIDLYRRYDLAELKGKLRNLKDIPQKSVKKSELLEFIEITDFLSSVII